MGKPKTTCDRAGDSNPQGSRNKAKPKRKKKHRLVPVTEVKISRKKNKDLISGMHLLNKLKTKSLTPAGHSANPDVTSLIKKHETDIDKLVGTDAYQKLSLAGEQTHGKYNASKWVIKLLHQNNLLQDKKKDSKLSLLDVGALSENYTSQAHCIDATAIDLNPQSPAIDKADFLTYRKGERDVYDVIVLSLVMNFVGDPSQRALMLIRAQELLKMDGHLFTVLPHRCLTNSRYLTEDVYKNMLDSLGFSMVMSHQSTKLSFHMFQKVKHKGKWRKFPKKCLCSGTKKNNFCIVFK